VLTADGQRVAIFILQRAPALTTFSINQYTPLHASREIFLPVLTLCGEEKEKTDAEAELVKLRKQHEQGIDLTKKPQTLREYGTDWLDAFALTGRSSTIAIYRWAFEAHTALQLGDGEVCQIRTPAVRKFITSLIREKLAPSSIRVVRAVLHQILEQAAESDGGEVEEDSERG
jgi:hypothetical protein